MYYYRINESIALKAIGAFPQSQTANHFVHVNSPNHLRNKQIPLKLEVESVSIPQPILMKKAKRTDLISVVSISLKLVMSNRLKTILEANIGKNDWVQFLPMTIVDKEEIVDYWLMSVYQYSPENINFQQSEIWLKKSVTPIKQLFINTVEEFLTLNQEIKYPESLSINKLVFHTEINTHFFALSRVSGGVGFYVSEKLKQEIEMAGCTGLSFEKVECV